MEVLTWIISGFIAGIMAKYLMPGKKPGGYVLSSVVGVTAAIIGGLVGSYIEHHSPWDFHLLSQLMALGSAILFLAVFRLHEQHKP